MSKRSIFNWSGGKDSALAFYYAKKDPQIEMQQLLTSISEEHQRISMHGVRRSLLEQQIESLKIPSTLLQLPPETDMAMYDDLMRTTLQPLVAEGAEYSIFGDIFLEDLKKYRENKLAEVGLKGLFPLWKRDTTELVHEFLDLGFRTLVVSIDGSKLDKSFAGRELDRSFLADLPKEVDPCGENGEFHTFVFDGPIFEKAIAFEKGELVGKEYKLAKDSDDSVTYYFQDLLPK